MQQSVDRIVSAFVRASNRQSIAEIPPNSLFVESMPGSENYFAAADTNGYWVLVVVAAEEGNQPPNLDLAHLSVEFGTTYLLHEESTTTPLRVSVIRCESVDPAVRVLFATFCTALMESLPPTPSVVELGSEVNNWVSLFWRLQAPARATLVGFIGEITLLDSVTNLPEWVRAWHSSPTDNLDFSFSTPPVSVEVKATTSALRVHEISIHQAVPPASSSHYFASVIVDLRETGTPIADVVREFSDRLAGTEEHKLLWQGVTKACGQSLDQFLGARYDRESARTTLLMFHAEEVPKPNVELPLPAGVLSLRYRADFSSTPASAVGPSTLLHAT